MSVPSYEELEILHDHICRAVGEPKRVQILYALANGPCFVNDLADLLDAPQPTISRHLAVLRQSGLVETERQGVAVAYSLAEGQIIDVLDQMREMLRRVLERQSAALE